MKQTQVLENVFVVLFTILMIATLAMVARILHDQLPVEPLPRRHNVTLWCKGYATQAYKGHEVVAWWVARDACEAGFAYGQDTK